MSSKKKSKKSGNLEGEIYGIAILAASLLIATSIYLTPSGVLGVYSREFFMGMFGIGAYIFPIIILLVGISLILNKGIIKIQKRFVLICLIIYDVIIMYHIYCVYSLGKKPFLNLLKISFNYGIKCNGGGVLSEIISYPVVYILGNVGSYILLISILIILCIYITNFSISDFIQGIISKKNIKKNNEKSNNSEIKIEPSKDNVETAKKNFEDNIEKADKKIKIIDFVKLDEDGKNNSNTLKNDKSDTDNEKFIKEIDKGKNENKDMKYSFPPIDLLKENKIKANVQDKKELLSNAKILEDALLSFGVEAKVIQVSRGPAVTRYELHPSPGVKVSRIVNLSDDIALNLAAPMVRIEAPIPGKAAVGIEIPNKEVMPVTLREVIESNEYNEFKSKLAFALGKDIGGKCIVTDLSKMPHLLIAGATGSGKSVCINSLIISLIYKSSPMDVKMLMIDPKVVELSVYNGIPHLLIPVVTDPKKAASALYWAVNEMEQRYKLFADNNVRNIDGYNALMEKSNPSGKIPNIVIIIDELSDLMMAAPNDVEDAICRLAQMARAAGMHIVIATQRPSVDVITGVIKANIPSRISFAVSSQIDSRTILDMAGAEKLLGKGDMLFYPIGENKPIRIQGAFISEKEVENIVEYLKQSSNANYDNEIIDEIDNNAQSEVSASDDCDELFSEAVKVAADYGQVSASMLQRRLRVGFNRAARLVEEMEARGFVGPQDGSKPRQLLVSKEELLNNIK